MGGEAAGEEVDVGEGGVGRGGAGVVGAQGGGEEVKERGGGVEGGVGVGGRVCEEGGEARGGQRGLDVLQDLAVGRGGVLVGVCGVCGGGVGGEAVDFAAQPRGEGGEEVEVLDGVGEDAGGGEV